LLVIYSYNHWIHAVSGDAVVADGGQDDWEKTAKVIAGMALG
jgi:hypothetical protein